MYQYQQQPSTIAQPVVIASASQSARINTKRILGLGIAQLIVGFIAIGMGVAAITMFSDYWLGDVGGGIWGGIWISLTGMVGIVTSKNPTKSGWVGTALAVNIIATLIAFIDGILFLVGLMDTNGCIYNYNYYYNYEYTYRYDRDCLYSGGSASAIFGLSMGLMGVEFFLALITSIYCCSGCCGSTSQGVIIQQPYQQFATTVSYQQGQQPIYSAQPAPYQQTGSQQYMQQNMYAPQAIPFQNGNYGYDTHKTEKESLVTNTAPTPVSYPSAPPPYNAN